MNQLDLIGSGDFVAEAEEKLAEVCRDVMSIGGSGKVTLTISVERSRKYGQLELSTKIESKLPKLPSGKTILFADDAGNLMTDDPRQGNLFEPKKVEGSADIVTDTGVKRMSSPTEAAMIRKLAADVYKAGEPEFKEA